MGARNRVGISLSYRPAWLHRLPVLIPWNRFLGSWKFKNTGSGFILTYLVPAEDHGPVVPVVQGVPRVGGVDPTRAEETIQQTPSSCNRYTVKKGNNFRGVDPTRAEQTIQQASPSCNRYTVKNGNKYKSQLVGWQITYPCSLNIKLVYSGRRKIFYSILFYSINCSRPGRVWLVTSRLGTGKSLTFFYSVYTVTPAGSARWLYLHILLLSVFCIEKLKGSTWLRRGERTV